MSSTPRVVIIGGGFAGLTCARTLASAPVEITLVDRQNHHLFQPLLYQVATAALSPADIAIPIRKVLRKQRNANVLLGEVIAIDREVRRVVLGSGEELGFDYLVVAPGLTHTYFGNDGWRDDAPGLKTIDDSLEIRRRFLLAFERAEAEDDEHERRAILTFAVIGAGPTGVELAGTMSEIARSVIKRDFRSIDTEAARVVLIEGGDRVLPGFPGACSESALRQLRGLGVEVMLGTRVTEINGSRLELGRAGSESESLEAGCVTWAAGVRGVPLGEQLGETDNAGRLDVEDDLSLPSSPKIFIAGDLARVEDGKGGLVPGMAPAAMQMGKHIGRTIRREVEGSAGKRGPFRFRDKGMLATIGRNRAVAHIFGRSFGGLVAWLLWVFVHIFFLIGFRNRVRVLMEWAWMYVFYERGARLITGGRRGACVALAALLVGCSGADRATTDRPARSVVEEGRAGLEVRWWVIDDRHGAVGRALREYGDAPVDAETAARWRSAGFRFVGVPAEDLGGLIGSWRTAGAVQEHQFRMAPSWTEIVRGRTLRRGSRVTTGGGEIELPRGYPRLVARAWGVPARDFGGEPGLRIELAAQHVAELARGDPRIALNTDNTVTFAGVRCAWTSHETECVLIVGELPGLDWGDLPEPMSDEELLDRVLEEPGPEPETEETDAVEEAEQPAASPLPANQQGPRRVSESLGEAMLTGEASDTYPDGIKVVVVLIARPPDEYSLIPRPR